MVALSSIEAGIRGIAKAITEITWLKKNLSELHFSQKKACRLFCDNKVTINLSENPIQHDCTKHMEIERHFTKEKLENKVVSLPFVRSRIN